MEKTTLLLKQDGAYLGEQLFYPVIGDIHYFRIYPTDWERRLLLCKEFGLNVIQTYVPWNLHEPKRGEFCFSGICDIDAYLSLCEKLGLYVFLRPSPYICSEWDLGGLPSWLLAKPGASIRCSDPEYLDAVEAYYQVLLPIIKPHLSTNGGCILALAIENEYGSFGTDGTYLCALADMYRNAGMDVPYYTTDGDSYAMQFMGSIDGMWRGANFRAKTGSAAAPQKLMRQIQPDMPFFVGEWWSGRSMHWDEPFTHRDPADVAEGYREALACGGYICFYMFAGGTNFGFMSGANHGYSFSPRPGTPARYIPHMTSYDEDALLSEDGIPTEKYFLCRDMLDDHLGKPRHPHIMPAHRTQSLTVELDRFAYLHDNIDVLTETEVFSWECKTMEALGQAYGYITYSTEIPGYYNPTPQPLYLRGVKDRALVFVNGTYRATVLRDRKDPEILLTMDGKPIRIDVIVENTGRINFGHKMKDERKGMDDGIYIGWQQKLYGFTIHTLPMRQLEAIKWQVRGNTGIPENAQVFFSGTFHAEPGIDTFADMRGFGDGFVVVNGFNIGRFRAVGPQRTLYLPGGLLKEENEILIFDSLHTENRGVLSLIGESVLCAPVNELLL